MIRHLDVSAMWDADRSGRAVLGLSAFFKPRWRPCKVSTLDELVQSGAYMDLCDTRHFVASALRAAQVMQSAHRRTILTDLAGVLSCETAELDFLFINPVVPANDIDPVAMPDYRATLHQEILAIAH